jgi:hypothetical protein
MKTIAQEWDQLERMVLNEDDSPAFKREMKRSFYAGAFAVQLQQKEMVVKVRNEKMTREEMAQVLRDQFEEVSRFFEELCSVNGATNAGQVTGK